MTTEKLTELEEAAADAVMTALGNGSWIDAPNASALADIGLEAIKRRAELAAQQANGNAPQAIHSPDIDEQGWVADEWAAWRLVLRGAQNPAVIYFSRKPTYAECKAFARAAEIPVNEAVAEERPL